MNIGFIGGGTMAEAMLSRILATGLASPDQITVSNRSHERRRYLAQQYGITATDDNETVIAGSDLIVLAVKPPDLPAVYAAVAGKFTGRQTLLSIVAGARIHTLASEFGHQAVIRAMPNMPAQIGAGITVWTSAPTVSETHRSAARAILSAMGESVYAEDETCLDMATALSGSGPAYIFLMLEALIDAGVYVGLPREMARRLTLQTVSGAADLAARTETNPAAHIDDPATTAGLQALEQAAVPAAIADAVNAAYRKSTRLGQRQA